MSRCAFSPSPPLRISTLDPAPAPAAERTAARRCGLGHHQHTCSTAQYFITAAFGAFRNRRKNRVFGAAWAWCSANLHFRSRRHVSAAMAMSCYRLRRPRPRYSECDSSDLPPTSRVGPTRSPSQRHICTRPSSRSATRSCPCSSTLHTPARPTPPSLARSTPPEPCRLLPAAPCSSHSRGKQSFLRAVLRARSTSNIFSPMCSRSPSSVWSSGGSL
ncbi:hypothetical protein DFH09DRAFT_411807 [Mycena vulgaris]|nr:hypothetical protein DFH09DRAFT_411807 [Mycena vulgaris]